MVFGLFGRGNREDAPRADKVREAIRFIVSSGFVVTGLGNVHRISEIQAVAKTSPEQSIKSSVKLTTESFKGRDLRYIEARVKEVTETLASDKLMTELAEEIIGETVDAARGRALVKGFRAGLENSEAYLKLMEAKSVREVESIERWIERSNAYQAVTGG